MVQNLLLSGETGNLDYACQYIKLKSFIALSMSFMALKNDTFLEKWHNYCL